MTAQLTQPFPPLRWPDKVLTAATWACATALFATVGWMAMSPADPWGAVSLVTQSGSSMMPQVAALAVVVAALVTALIGRKLPDAGTFAVAVGLAVANLQGKNATYVLTYVMQGGAEARRSICGSLALEGLIWFAILALTAVVSALVMRWCYGRNGSDNDAAAPRLSVLSVADVPWLGRRVIGAAAGEKHVTPTTNGLTFTAITIVGAVVLFRVLAAGSSHERAVQHGQVYFAIAASFLIAHWLACRVVPVRTPLWGCLAVPVVCIIGYIWASVQSDASGPYAEIASVPPSVYMRALPIEYITVGTAAVIASFWSCRPDTSPPVKQAARQQ